MHLHRVKDYNISGAVLGGSHFFFFLFLLRTASSDLKINLKNMLGFYKKIKIKLKKPFRVSKL
jgi:hypothetical protein